MKVDRATYTNQYPGSGGGGVRRVALGQQEPRTRDVGVFAGGEAGGVTGQNTLAESGMWGTKGLQNKLGQHNCFLNVVIQSLWHLKSFRDRFSSAEEQENHHHVPNACVYCALKVVFTQYQFTDDDCLPPTALRQALDVLFRPMERFQLDKMDDAEEALQAVLHCLHVAASYKLSDQSSANSLSSSPSLSSLVLTDQHSSVEPGVDDDVVIVGSGSDLYVADEDDLVCNPACISHQVFGIEIVEQVKCQTLGSSSEPQTASMFMFRTYAQAVREFHCEEPTDPFDVVLGKVARMDCRPCGSPLCKQQHRVNRYVLAAPKVFTVGVVWTSANPTSTEIEGVMECIDMDLDVSHLFDECLSKKYRLQGMICYYGLHYNAYFHDSKRSRWYVFDDAMVKAVANQWDEVRRRCVRGRFQPSVLFFEACDDAAADSDQSPVAVSAAGAVVASSPSSSSSLLPLEGVDMSTRAIMEAAQQSQRHMRMSTLFTSPPLRPADSNVARHEDKTLYPLVDLSDDAAPSHISAPHATATTTSVRDSTPTSSTGLVQVQPYSNNTLENGGTSPRNPYVATETTQREPHFYHGPRQHDPYHQYQQQQQQQQHQQQRREFQQQQQQQQPPPDVIVAPYAVGHDASFAHHRPPRREAYYPTTLATSTTMAVSPGRRRTHSGASDHSSRSGPPSTGSATGSQSEERSTSERVSDFFSDVGTRFETFIEDINR